MKLRVVRGENPGQVLFLVKDSFSIGRMGDNDYVISEGGVSRYHCLLTQDKVGWWIENKSGNGTLLNGRRVEARTAVKSGDEITVSECVLKLEGEEGTSAVSRGASLDSPTSDEPTGDTEDADAGASGSSRWLVKAVVAVVVLAVLGALGYGGYRFWSSRSAGGEVPVAEEVAEAPLATEVDAAADAAEAGGEERAEAKGASRGESLLKNSGDAVKAEAVAKATEAVAPPAPAEAVKSAMASVKDEDEEGEDDEAPRGANREREAEPSEREGRSSADAGMILVKSEPSDAEVMLDGRNVGRTPVLVRDVKAGQHSLELTKDGYERMMSLVDYPSEVPSDSFKLVQKVGTLNVVTEPSGAVVREGRRIYGTTPLLITKMNPGKHELTLERMGYAAKRVSVELTASKGESVSETLQKQLGGLEVFTAPAGCNVYIDNVLVGCTEADEGKLMSQPLVLEDVVPGNCTLRVQHVGTGLHESDSIAIPRGRSMVKKVYMWVPTHTLTLLDGRKVVGMVIKRTSDKIDLMNVSNKGESYLVAECTDVKELTVEEQKDILKNKASLREPSGSSSQKSVLSVTAEEFYAQAKSQSFQLQYKGKRLCITGDVSARFKNPKGIQVVQFGKQLRCMMTAGISEEEIKTIGEQTKQELPVALRGEYEGMDRDGVHVLKNCVLLPYAD